MSESRISVLPSPTWRWLKVNDIEIDNIATIGSLDKVTFEKKDETKHFVYAHEGSTRDCLEIEAKEGSNGTVVIDHTSSGLGESFALTLNFNLDKNCEVNLVEIVRVDNKDTLLSGCMGEIKDGAKLNVIQVFLSGKKVYSNIVTDLVGDRSFINIKSAYRLYKENALDINYVVNHIGRKSECNLDSKGVLYNGASKVYRGTIDFKKGCKGSVGYEIEDVLLMDSDVINKTVPVILCGEDDVEGNHGASIGQIDEESLFYLTSRGLDKQSAITMIADSRLEGTIRQIPDKETVDDLFLYLGKSDEDN